MLDKLIDTVVNTLTLDHKFDAETLELVTTTYIGKRLVHENTFSLEPIYQAIKTRLDHDDE